MGLALGQRRQLPLLFAFTLTRTQTLPLHAPQIFYVLLQRLTQLLLPPLPLALVETQLEVLSLL